jgi:prevent-host-death family protein
MVMEDRHSDGGSADSGPPRLGIRELRARLTSLVRRAGGGERIVITIAGRPVAQLGPVEAADAQLTIDDLVARGLLEPAHRGDRPTDPGVQIDTWTGGRLDRALREVRGA